MDSTSFQRVSALLFNKNERMLKQMLMPFARALRLVLFYFATSVTRHGAKTKKNEVTIIIIVALLLENGCKSVTCIAARLKEMN